MMRSRFLVLGGGVGWHSDQLVAAAHRSNCQIAFAPYETLSAHIAPHLKPCRPSGIPQPMDGNRGTECANRDAECCSVLNATAAIDNDQPSRLVALEDFDAVLTRTMPPGSLEQITFRLANLHAHVAGGHTVINQPRGLELAIDKFAALEHISRLGYDVPETMVVQNRRDAMEAFKALGSDCVVKPLFGGEGRGVMRIVDAELAWYCFSTLEQLGAIFYVQRFISPGGCDTRLLVIGDSTIALRRENANDFRTNVSGGAVCREVTASDDQIKMARHITTTMGLAFASVDILDSDDGRPRVLEVNAVPGWRGAQKVTEENIADLIIQTLQRYDIRQPLSTTQP